MGRRCEKLGAEMDGWVEGVRLRLEAALSLAALLQVFCCAGGADRPALDEKERIGFGIFADQIMNTAGEVRAGGCVAGVKG
ncbi:MAG: hypothetical protein ABSF53_24415 [Terracidiphilus sp.]